MAALLSEGEKILRKYYYDIKQPSSSQNDKKRFLATKNFILNLSRKSFSNWLNKQKLTQFIMLLEVNF